MFEKLNNSLLHLNRLNKIIHFFILKVFYIYIYITISIYYRIYFYLTGYMWLNILYIILNTLVNPVVFVPLHHPLFRLAVFDPKFF